jgi:hypothetical protein
MRIKTAIFVYNIIYDNSSNYNIFRIKRNNYHIVPFEYFYMQTANILR